MSNPFDIAEAGLGGGQSVAANPFDVAEKSLSVSGSANPFDIAEKRIAEPIALKGFTIPDDGTGFENPPIIPQMGRQMAKYTTPADPLMAKYSGPKYPTTPWGQTQLAGAVADINTPKLPVESTAGQVATAAFSPPKPFTDMLEIGRGIQQNNRDTTLAMRAMASKHGLDPDSVAKLPALWEQYLTGAANAGIDLGLSFTSPLGVTTLGFGGLPKAVQKAASLGFSAQMLSQFPEQTKALLDEEAKPEGERDNAKIAQMYLGALSSAGFGVLAGAHGTSKAEPSVPHGTIQPANPFDVAEGNTPPQNPIAEAGDQLRTESKGTAATAEVPMAPAIGEKQPPAPPANPAAPATAGAVFDLHKAVADLEATIRGNQLKQPTEAPTTPAAEPEPVSPVQPAKVAPEGIQEAGNAPGVDKAQMLQDLKALENPTPDQIAARDRLQAESDALKQSAGWGGFQKPSPSIEKPTNTVQPPTSQGAELSANRKTIYHGASIDVVKKIENQGFDVSKSADGTIWFTDNKSAIEKGEVAASGKGGIIERQIDESKLKLGGWDEMDKYSTDQLIAMGYDGLKLPGDGETTYQIFHPEKLLKSFESPRSESASLSSKTAEQPSVPVPAEAASTAALPGQSVEPIPLTPKAKETGAPSESTATDEIQNQPKTENENSDGNAPNTHGIAARVLDNEAGTGELNPIKPGEGISAEQSVKRGRELLNQEKDPNASFEDLTKGKPLSDQVAIVRAKSEQLKKAANDAFDQKGSDSPEYKSAQQAYQDWAEKTKTLATEAHKAMMAHQGEVDLDTGDFHALRQAHLKSTGYEFEPNQEARAKKIAADSAKAQKDLEDSKQKTLDAIKKATERQNIPSDYVLKIARRIGEKLDSRADAARERIKKRFSGQLNADAGLKAIASSLASLRDEIEIGASHIFHIGEDFGEWSKSMIDELGNRIKPHLEDIFKASKQLLDSEGESTDSPNSVKRAIRRKKSNPAADALDAANKTVREAAIRAAEAETKARVKTASIPNDLENVQRDAAKKALKVAQKAAREAAAKLADSENRERVANAAKPDPNAIQDKLAQKALLVAQRVARNAAARLAEEETKARVAKTEAKKKLAKIQIDAAKKAVEKAVKVSIAAAERAATAENKLRILKADKKAYVLSKVKEYIEAGEKDYGKIISKVAVDTGMSADQVRTELGRDKYVKQASDEMYAKQRMARQIQQSAKQWLNDQQKNTIALYAGKIPRALFNAKVFGHGTVGFITHAGNQMFQPMAAKNYWTNFLRQYPMAFGKGGIYHEKMMEDLQNHPLYNKALRAGLVIDPHKFSDDYQQPGMTGWFGQMGNRGFDALKLYRMAEFERQWNDLPKSIQTKEMATMLADEINHSTGVVKASIPKALQSTLTTAFFAPKLEASRWAWLIGDPAKSISTAANWAKATPEEKYAAISQFKKKAWVVGTYFAALAANQGLLSAMGSNQKINFTDPKKPDWLSFKVAGHNVGVISPTISLIRFLGKELHDLAGQRTAFQKLQGSRLDAAATHVGQYARNKLSPFGGLVADSADRHDFAGNTMPYSNEKPKYKDSHHLTYAEYAANQILPIPFEDALHEVWKSQGVGDGQIKTYLNALISGAIVGGTGARLSTDTK